MMKCNAAMALIYELGKKVSNHSAKLIIHAMLHRGPIAIQMARWLKPGSVLGFDYEQLAY